MSIQFLNGQILFVDGQIAFHEDCCCEEAVCEYCDAQYGLPEQFEVNLQGWEDWPCSNCEEQLGGTFTLDRVSESCTWKYTFPVDLCWMKWYYLGLGEGYGGINFWGVTLTGVFTCLYRKYPESPIDCTSLVDYVLPWVSDEGACPWSGGCDGSNVICKVTSVVPMNGSRKKAIPLKKPVREHRADCPRASASFVKTELARLGRAECQNCEHREGLLCRKAGTHIAGVRQCPIN